VAGAAVLERLTWRVARVRAVRAETGTARTIVLDVPGWPGHLAGQHVDLRLTAADGYSAQRSYSLASAGRAVELTVQRVEDGEVSGFLVDELRPGDELELRGPVGGYFVWRPEWTVPVLLLAGGSGVVPLMAMVRARAAAGSAAPFRLLYAARRPADVIYRAELAAARIDVRYAYSRSAPPGEPVRRIDAVLLAAAAWPASDRPLCYLCGPTGFVEAMADLLVAAGHQQTRIRTERFG
jgi:ferredoxin-NADP reductase